MDFYIRKKENISYSKGNVSYCNFLKILDSVYLEINKFELNHGPSRFRFLSW